MAREENQGRREDLVDLEEEKAARKRNAMRRATFGGEKVG